AMEALLFDKPPNLFVVFSHLVVIDGGPVIASDLGIHPLRGLVILVFKIIPKLASHGAATTTYAFGNVYQYTFAHGLYLRPQILSQLLSYQLLSPRGVSGMQELVGQFAHGMLKESLV